MSAFEKLNHAVDNFPANWRDPEFDMGRLQEPALLAIQEKLNSPEDWKGIQITYEPPFLNRIYFTVPKGDQSMFFSLHYFFDATGKLDTAFSGQKNPYETIEKKEETGDNLYHPHPWAASFRLLDGAYYQYVGQAHDLGLKDAPTIKRMYRHDASDSKNCAYAFNNPKLWHEVMPTENSASTLMISYRPLDWEQTGPTPPEKQRSLAMSEIAVMCTHFKPVVDRAIAGPKPEIYRFS